MSRKNEIPLLGPEKSLAETSNESSCNQNLFDYWEVFAVRLKALEKRADKPTFPLECSSLELDAKRAEVSKLAMTGRLYLRQAYLRYLSALGFSVEDANFLVDNIEGPCGSNFHEKVERAERVLEPKVEIIPGLVRF